MPAQKHTIVSITAARNIANGAEACIVMEMRFGGEDVSNPDKCMRDMQRALQTFQIHADVEDKNVFRGSVMHGPYSLGDQKGVIAVTVFLPREGVDENAFSAKIRSGVNGVTSLLRQGSYRVKARIKPIEQLELPESAAQASTDPKPEGEVAREQDPDPEPEPRLAGEEDSEEA